MSKVRHSQIVKGPVSLIKTFGLLTKYLTYKNKKFVYLSNIY